MVGAIAAGLGFVVRLLASIVRALPGIVGPMVVVYGVWLVYEPAGWVVAGLVIWLWDIVTGTQLREGKQEDE